MVRRILSRFLKTKTVLIVNRFLVWQAKFASQAQQLEKTVRALLGEFEAAAGELVQRHVQERRGQIVVERAIASALVDVTALPTAVRDEWRGALAKAASVLDAATFDKLCGAVLEHGAIDTERGRDRFDDSVASSCESWLVGEEADTLVFGVPLARLMIAEARMTSYWRLLCV